MKRTKLKRKSKSEVKKLQDKLWSLCREITRLKYGHTCYTCGRTNLEGANWQTGHFIPKASCPAELKYDLDNLRIQCYFCNINLGGNGGQFYRNLERDMGKEYIDKLFKSKNTLVKADKQWYEQKINEYEKILSDLRKASENN